VLLLFQIRKPPHSAKLLLWKELQEKNCNGLRMARQEGSAGQFACFTENRCILSLFLPKFLFPKKPKQMQDIELRFSSLKDLMQFKQLSQVKELRIDTNEKSLTGKFSETELIEAVKQFKAIYSAN
jgi:hypothetical protein